MERTEWVVTVDGARLDAAAAELTGLSRSAAVRLIEEGNLLLSGKPADKKTVVRAGDVISVALPDPVPTEAVAQDIPLDVIYEDGDIIVINKPSGMVVHPAPGNPDGTLVNALLEHCGSSLSGIGGVIRPGIVHRIDKDTSGLLVVAKNDEAHLALSEQIKVHGVIRVYTAIALGSLHSDEGVIDRPIGRNPADRKKMAVIRDPRAHSREAVTHYAVLERYAGATLVRCELETGRTHQIRVHLSSIGHPILGDPLYGGVGNKLEKQYRDLISGQCLHAGELRLRHPRTGEEMTFQAPLPDSMSALIAKLRKTER